MHKTFLLFLFLLFLINSVKCQDDFTFPKSGDIGLNITNVLSSFIGNSSNQDNIASYPFVAKLNYGRNAVRFGVGFTFDNSNETFVNIEQFIFNNYQLNARVGWERKKYLGNRFGFYYGLDLVTMIKNEETTVSNSIDVTSIRTDTQGLGGGLVYGFEYYINKFMYLGTEGNIYGLYKISKRTESFQFNMDINSERKIIGFEAQITPPVNLYVMVRF
ncbi:hypothetical protein [Portibacter marinus]|uniref:hypothetical protein n=1 Tax=Portibacter marinus TaxID=2898660 RepID=UPI001F1ED478|nr:hypothetical protein [Portibacter marinus]